MRIITASAIFPVSGPPIHDGYIVCDHSGTIREVFDPLKATPEQHTAMKHSSVERVDGFICPGFINAHCHLELSHLRGKINPGEGLDEFIRNIELNRIAGTEEVLQAITAAEQEMIRNGIVAVGDISNGSASFQQKMQGRMKYHTFIEVFGFDPDKAGASFGHGAALAEGLSSLIDHDNNKDNTFSISPHAPYSASLPLLKKISARAIEHHAILSMHNQENEEENKFFREKKGSLLKRLAYFGIDISAWKPTGFNSLQSALMHLPRTVKIQLVHNTVTTKVDIEQAEEYSRMLYWCLCPNANLYIENRLPDLDLFAASELKVTIGTDSLASNNQLSILEEIKTIAGNNSRIQLDKLLKWSTLNGAEFLGLAEHFGSLEAGKKPGINLITNVDIEHVKLKKNSAVLKLV